MQYFVYITASKRNGTLYTGVTRDLVKRIYEHKGKFVDSFTKRYGVDKLVYYEIHEDVEEAIKREKRIKKYTRKAKLEMVEKNNPAWKDLYREIIH
jgi:putative endonuclease